MIRARQLNLGLSFPLSKVPSNKSYHSPWWVYLSDVWHTFDRSLVLKVKKLCCLIGTPGAGIDGTFDKEKHQPKFK